MEKTLGIFILLAINCLAIHGKSLDNPAVLNDDGLLANETLECITREWATIAQDDPDSAELLRNGTRTLQQLRQRMLECRTDFCRWRAQTVALQELRRLQRELQQRPELARRVREAVVECVRRNPGKEEHSHYNGKAKDISKAITKLVKVSKYLNTEKATSNAATKIEISAEAAQCIREQIRIVRDRHQDHKEFVEWCNGVLADIDRFESELNECNGKLCRNLVKLKAVLRWRSAKKELKEIDPNDELRHEVERELKQCGI